MGGEPSESVGSAAAAPPGRSAEHPGRGASGEATADATAPASEPPGEMAPPPPRRQPMAPPPPRFAEPPPKPASKGAVVPPQQATGSAEQAGAVAESGKTSKAELAAAVAKAVANVAPGQQDRAIADATRAVMAQQLREAQQAADTAADGAGVSGTSYTPPSWAGVPGGVPYSLEVLRDGAVLSTQRIDAKDHYTFGRVPGNDFVLEHPSSSRLHAVLQYNGETKTASIYDCGSTHGTFVNKQRVKANIFVPLPVGSTFRLGQSSRIYVFNGPAELMPEEGLSRAQKKQLAQLEYARRMQEQDRESAKAQMAAAVAGEVTWGMGGPEAADMDPDDESTVDWRVYRSSNTLNDRQQKMAEKVRSKEYKVANLRKEVERIQAKEKGEGGLSSGQAATLVRNEQVIEKLEEEIEELDEQLNESVLQALRDKRKAAGGEDPSAAKKRRGGLDADDERYLEGSDSDDEMYDRTRASAKASAKRPKKGEKQKAAIVESAQTLYGKREVLGEEREALLKAIAAEEQRQTGVSKAPADAARGDGTGDVAPGTSTAAGAASASRSAAGGEDDSLDAFMGTMRSQMDVDKLAEMRTQLEELDAQLARCTRLLKIADPDGWLKPGSRAATAAKASALQAREGERQRRAEEARAKAQTAAEAHFAEEFDEDEDRGGDGDASAATGGAASAPAPAVDKDGPPAGGPPEASDASGPSAQDASAGHPAVLIKRQGGKPGASAPSKPRSGGSQDAAAAAAAAQLISEFSASASAGRAAGHTKPLGGRAAPGRLHASELAAEMAADAKVAADMAFLAAAEKRALEADDAEWVPPADQTGDGRTSLNEKLGY